MAHEVLWLTPLALLLQSSSSECPEIMARDVNGRACLRRVPSKYRLTSPFHETNIPELDVGLVPVSLRFR